MQTSFLLPRRESDSRKYAFFVKKKDPWVQNPKSVGPTKRLSLPFGKEIVRRTCCPARRAEFFLYEKMGRRAIVPAESISEARTEILHPITPKRWESKGTRPLGKCSRAELSRFSPFRSPTQTLNRRLLSGVEIECIVNGSQRAVAVLAVDQDGDLDL